MTQYRNLSPGEQAILQQCRDLEDRCAAFAYEVSLMPNTDHRALALAKTGMQEALMWLTRAITAPTTNWK